ncbi:hypothetical protein D3C81_1845360 [compost metagenome]
MLGTLMLSMATPAWRMLPICMSEKMPRPSISRPISAKPSSARGAMFMLRRDMEGAIQAKGRGRREQRRNMTCLAIGRDGLVLSERSENCERANLFLTGG